MAGSVARRPNGKWRARYRDETGHEHTRHFDRKVDAQQWLDQVTAAVVTGTYADPKAGQITFAAIVYYDRQLGAPSHERGPRLHPFCLTAQLEIVALLNLRPEAPAIRHVLIDDQGPALVCRQWRSFLIHDGNYGPLEPAVLGADLIIRPDLYDSVETIIGKTRIDLGITVRHAQGAEPGDDLADDD